jgi:protein-S-isoprenylcysteine O-methyltransferase Ste14
VRSRAQLLDAAERILVLGFYIYLSVRVLQSFLANANPVLLLLLLSEGFVVIFLILRRRTQDISLNPRDWLLAVGGTVGPLLVQPGGAELVPGFVSILLMVFGISLQVMAKATLGRGFGIVPANRGVIIGGPYRVLRHPIYAGYLLTHIGFFLDNPSPWNAIIYLAVTGFQIARILAEEVLLSRDPSYRAFVGKVRYRLVPGIF